MTNKTTLVDLGRIDEIEYEGHLITKIEPQYRFFVITPLKKGKKLNDRLGGKWTSPMEAMAAIDAAIRRGKK